MKKNMGSADRIIRIVIAAVVLGLFLGNIVTGTLGIILLVAAGIFAITGFIGTCPAYMPFGIKTCPTKTEG